MAPYSIFGNNANQQKLLQTSLTFDIVVENRVFCYH